MPLFARKGAPPSSFFPFLPHSYSRRRPHHGLGRLRRPCLWHGHDPHGRAGSPGRPVPRDHRQPWYGLPLIFVHSISFPQPSSSRFPTFPASKRPSMPLAASTRSRSASSAVSPCSIPGLLTCFQVDNIVSFSDYSTDKEESIVMAEAVLPAIDFCRGLQPEPAQLRGLRTFFAHLSAPFLYSSDNSQPPPSQEQAARVQLRAHLRPARHLRYHPRPPSLRRGPLRVQLLQEPLRQQVRPLTIPRSFALIFPQGL